MTPIHSNRIRPGAADLPFGDALERFAKEKTLDGRTILVRGIDRPAQSFEFRLAFVKESVPLATETI